MALWSRNRFLIEAIQRQNALRRLSESESLIRVLGEPFVAAFSIVKSAEYEVFLQVISSWEREHLLLNV